MCLEIENPILTVQKGEPEAGHNEENEAGPREPVRPFGGTGFTRHDGAPLEGWYSDAWLHNRRAPTSTQRTPTGATTSAHGGGR